MKIKATKGSARTRSMKSHLRKCNGKKKAKVAVVSKLLVPSYALTNGEADQYAKEEQVAAAFFAHAFKVGVKRLPKGMTAKLYTRQQLDRLGIGKELTGFQWGSKWVSLPPSRAAPS